MSRSVVVYSVPPDPLGQAWGSRDAGLKRSLAAAAGAETPEQVAAAHRLVDGLPPTHEAPAVIHGFELVCARFGRTLPNRSLSPAPGDFLDALDRELKAQQFPFTIYRLILGGGPLKLPWADDFPTVGHIEPAVVQAAAVRAQDQPLTSPNPDLDAALFELGNWVATAAPRGDMLVGFWY
jgi:hypothetical protein